MAKMADCIFTVTPPDPVRALPAEEFARVIREFNPKVTACTSLKEAVGRSFVAANSEDAILSFGSLSFVGEVTRLVKERAGEMKREKQHDRFTGDTESDPMRSMMTY